MRRIVSGLLVAVVAAGCASGPVSPSPTPTPYLVAANATPTAMPPTATPTATASPVETPAPTPTPTPITTPTPTPVATPTPQSTPRSTDESGEPAWTKESVVLLRSAGDTDDTVAHLGPGYPVSLDGLSATIGNRIWERVSWQTPARRGSGWLPVSALDTTRPKLVPSAGIDALDASLAAYLSKIGSRVGVQVRDITRGTVYGYNADRSYITASSRKVQIMLAFLDKCELAHREPTSSEMALLTKMIEHSDNAAADALYDAIGGGPGMSAYMRKIGVTGLVPSDPGSGIEWSTITPASMVHVLYLLQTGAVLTPEHRALALNLMGHVQTDQRLGVADTAPAGATVAMKVGWVVGPDGLWLVNSSGILTLRGETYAIAVFTEKGRSFEDGRGIVRHVCAAIAADLT